MILTLDTETKSSADLARCGAHKYVEDEDFAVLLLSYGFDDEPLKLIDLTVGETIPQEFIDAYMDLRVEKWAHNSAFDRIVLDKWLGLTSPLESWWDDMVLCAVCGLPMGLGAAGAALGVPEDKAKDREGKALIRWFCQPYKTKKDPTPRWRDPKDYPEKWEKFKAYCLQDVEAERYQHKLLERWKPDAVEHRGWLVDQKINDRGVRIDLTLARAAMQIDDIHKADLSEQAIELTGMENPNSVAQVKAWLAEQEGIEVPSLNKKVVADVVAQLETDKAKDFMAIRAELAKSSTKKYAAMVESACADDHARGCFQFYGAGRTGRWAGRRIQLQNMSKNKMEDLSSCRALVRAGDLDGLKLLYGNVSGCLSELVRTALIPEQGHKFIVCDYSAIESRVLNWIAGEEWVMEEFRGDGLIYEATGARMFGVPKMSIAKGGENHDLRASAKVAELACGYGGGMGAMKAFGADKMGMTDEDIVRAVDLWRGAHPSVVRLWKALERAAIRCVVHGTPQVSTIGNIAFQMEKGILWMTLPSGRRISYFGIRYAQGTGKYTKGKKVLSYMGQNQQTRKWVRIETYGPKMTENCWAAGTPILTDRGWVPIEQVELSDKLWDGFDWVSHDGRLCQGRMSTIELDGRYVTPDHKILTTEGWVNAEKCEGLHRAQVQLPDRVGAEREPNPGWETTLDCAVRMRRETTDASEKDSGIRKSRETRLVRMQEERAHSPSEDTPWYVSPPSFRGVALNDCAVYEPEAQGMEELRRARHHGMRRVAEQLRGLLGRYGADLSRRIGLRPEGQRARLLRGKLSLGDQNRELSKQAQRASGEVGWEGMGPEGAGRNEWGWVHDPAVSAGPRLRVGTPAGQTRPPEPVFDLKNAGPRHQYVVLGKTGPLIAHNCVQAVARDCLRDAMIALDEAGYDICAHIHDEVIITEPVDGRTVDDVAAIMGKPPAWAADLPLRGDGYETPYYRKD